MWCTEDCVLVYNSLPGSLLAWLIQSFAVDTELLLSEPSRKHVGYLKQVTGIFE